MADYQSKSFSSQRIWGTCGGCALFLAVAIGAFGTHVLAEETLPRVHAENSNKVVAGLEVPASYHAYLNFRTGVLYQMVHGLAMVLVGLLGRRGTGRVFSHAAGISFVLGILLFCCPLYAMATMGTRGVHLVVPLGGIAFLAGWIFFITAAALPRTRASKI